MKENLKSINIASLLSSIYFAIVWTTYIYLKLTINIFVITMILILIIVGSYFLFDIIIRKLGTVEIKPINLTLKSKRNIFIKVTTVVFLIRLMWILAYYPGSFSSDSIGILGQYGQAMTGTYDDWHPVLHTILFFTVPLKIFGNPVAIIIIQNMYFALVLGYFAITLTTLWNVKLAVLSVAYIIFNPYTGNIMLFPWKDVAFSICGLLCTIMAIKLALKKQESYKTWKLIILGILLACTTIFRHNAILFTAPLIIVLIFHVDKKTWIKIFLAFAISIFLIKIPLYTALGVTKPGKRVLESSGLPLTVIGNVVKETPNLLDEELSQFVYSIASQEDWNDKYKCGNFNSIKWAGVDTSIVEKTGNIGMIKLMGKCFLLSPRASFRALIALTDLVYSFKPDLGDAAPVIVENSYGIAYTGTNGTFISTLVSVYNKITKIVFLRCFRAYGFALFAMLLVVLSKLKFNSWRSWKKAIMVVPIFCYDFGTMLLLTDSDARFFYITFLVTPLMIVYTLTNGGKYDNE